MTQEQVIEALKRCTQDPSCGTCTGCPYEGVGDTFAKCCLALMLDCLNLLKAQEPPTNTSITSAIECLLHPQDADDSDMAQAIDTAVRAMRSLKAHEAVEPRIIDTSSSKLYHNDMFKNYYCGNCGEFLHVVNRKDLFCSQCGTAVKWG